MFAIETQREREIRNHMKWNRVRGACWKCDLCALRKQFPGFKEKIVYFSETDPSREAQASNWAFFFFPTESSKKIYTFPKNWTLSSPVPCPRQNWWQEDLLSCREAWTLLKCNSYADSFPAGVTVIGAVSEFGVRMSTADYNSDPSLGCSVSP